MAGRGRTEPYDEWVETGPAAPGGYGPSVGPEPYDDGDTDSWPDRPMSPRRRRRGPHIGPLAITPTRVTLAIALIGSGGFLAYAITVRDPSQIPLLASGAAVLGLVFAALALSGAIGAMRAGRSGAGGRAFAMALGGGLASVIAFGCFGAAIVLALVWRR